MPVLLLLTLPLALATPSRAVLASSSTVLAEARTVELAAVGLVSPAPRDAEVPWGVPARAVLPVPEVLDRGPASTIPITPAEGAHFGFSRALGQGNASPSSTLLPAPSLITVAGQTNANATYDIASFDPVRRVLYYSTRSNNGVTAIDTTTNTVLGVVPMPADCVLQLTARGASCPSGVEVIPDLRKLVVTDRGGAPPTGSPPSPPSRTFIFDISTTPTPQTIQATINMGAALQSDELAYNPLNHRVYVGNTAGSPFVTVIDVVSNVLVGQIPITTPGVCDTTVTPSDCGIEQPRWNPNDGMIYQALSSVSKVLRIDPTVGTAGAIVATFDVAPCMPNGLDIDALNNTALLGCNSGNTTQMTLLNLSTGVASPATGPRIDGADGLYLNPNNGRFYTANQSDRNQSVPACPARPAPNTTQFPVLGIFQAGPDGAKAATVVGTACTGDGGHSVGVDTIGNQIYVGVSRFPANGGPPGILVFQDPAPPVQARPTQAGAVLSPIGGNTARGFVSFAHGSPFSVVANISPLPGGTPLQLVVTTTVGNEVVRCTGTGTAPTCTGTLVGDPLIGGVADLSSGGVLVAQGPITLITAPVVPPGQNPPPSTGQANTSCGISCLASGAVTGSSNRTNPTTAGGHFSFSATGPANTAPGGTPAVFIPTTIGVESFACGVVPLTPPFTTTCSGTTIGDPLQGATITIRFPIAGDGTTDVTGTINGAGIPVVVVPVVPPVAPPVIPPVSLLPPPLPPLLPPPFLSPPPMMAPMGAPMGPSAAPGVPVIPEADSLVLLLGGLTTLAGVAGLRARRRRHD